MSHEMTNEDTAAYAIKPAWHGLGTVVEDYMTPREALKKSELDWLVTPSVNTYFRYEHIEYNEDTQSIETYMCTVEEDTVVANVRNDTGRVLGVVGDSYSIVQNKELADIAYAVAGDGTKVETMGSLRGGRQVYMLIKMDKFSVAQYDPIQPYFLLSNGHDGKLALSGKPTSIRVVCANTLDMALHGNSSFRFTHRGDKTEHIIEAKAMMKEMQATGKIFKKQSRDLSRYTMNTKEIQRFWLEIYEHIEGKMLVPNAEHEEGKKNWLKGISTVGKWSELFDDERKEYGYTANVWVAMNAVTNWMDHNRSFRGKNKEDNRVHSALFGRGARLKQDIFQKALELI